MASKKLSEEDIFITYKASYRVKIQWKDILPRDAAEWIETYEYATNCPRALSIPALTSLTSALCGPGTSVVSNSFKSTINQYIFAICAPGGGKSNTFDRIVHPVMEEIERICGQNISLETYTTAGIQKLQTDNGGYGLITGDEGERFLSTITQKQKQGESERALLCKMWNGKGDSSMLSSGARGFSKTSMSAYILIQPQTFIQELIQLNADDGLIDRFLFFSDKPVFRPTNILVENITKLRRTNMDSFEEMFSKMFRDHKDVQRTYTLSSEAQRFYNNLVDNYAKYMQEKYNSDSSSGKFR